jgi:hypothetical protein
MPMRFWRKCRPLKRYEQLAGIQQYIAEGNGTNSPRKSVSDESSLPFMMKKYRMNQEESKRRNGAEEHGARATSLLVAALHLVPWFHIP